MRIVEVCKTVTLSKDDVGFGIKVFTDTLQSAPDPTSAILKAIHYVNLLLQRIKPVS